MALESNIRKYSIFQFFRYFIIFIPIIVLFWQENGLDLRQIFILQAVFSILVVMVEVPSGFFADIYGRKTSMIVGSLAITISSIIYALGHGFAGFLIAEVIWGLGYGFISGADTALIYDTLVDLKRKDDYKKIEGHALFLGGISSAAASILAGFMAKVSLRTVMYATILPMAMLFFVALSLEEPERHVRIHKKGRLHHIYKIAISSLHRNKPLKWIILFSSIVSCITLLAFWLYQPYFELIGLPIVYFGLIYAGISVFEGIFLKYSHVYEKKFGLKIALISLPVLCAIAFFAMGSLLFAFSFIFIFIFQFVSGVSLPIINDMLNRRIFSGERATILSLSNMVYRMFFAALSPFIGWFADVYTIPQALMLSGFIVLAGGGVTLIMLFRHKVL